MWERKICPYSNRRYRYNPETHESIWEDDDVGTQVQQQQPSTYQSEQASLVGRIVPMAEQRNRVSGFGSSTLSVSRFTIAESFIILFLGAVCTAFAYMEILDSGHKSTPCSRHIFDFLSCFGILSFLLVLLVWLSISRSTCGNFASSLF